MPWTKPPGQSRLITRRGCPCLPDTACEPRTPSPPDCHCGLRPREPAGAPSSSTSQARSTRTSAGRWSTHPLARTVADRPTRLVVHMAAPAFCDSTAVNALLGIRGTAEAAGVELTLAALPAQARRLLKITGVNEVLALFGSVRAAPRPARAGEPAMDRPSRYAVTMPGPPPGRHGPPEVVIVHATGEVTADGTPIYQDEAGAFRVAITGDVARPVSTATGRGPAHLPARRTTAVSRAVACATALCPRHEGRHLLPHSLRGSLRDDPLLDRGGGPREGSAAGGSAGSGGVGAPGIAGSSGCGHGLTGTAGEHLLIEGIRPSAGSAGDAYDCQSFRTGSRKDRVAPAEAV
ncbi:DUF6296 family protein [Kitasatospora sp. NPDC085879]|uniref:DUF6296 family protein n=1 Tax=Kitasatospora sp. NPDC085879 TaxID=3154769 RepID=UPI003433FB59